MEVWSVPKKRVAWVMRALKCRRRQLRLRPNTKQAEKDLRNCHLSFHPVVLWVSFVSTKFSLSFSLHLSGGLGILSLDSSSSGLESNRLNKSKQTQGGGPRSETASESPAPALGLQLHPQRQENPQPGRSNRAALHATGTALGSPPLLFPLFPTWTIMVFPEPFAQVSRSQLLVSNVP